MLSAMRRRRLPYFFTVALVAALATGATACGESEEDKVRGVIEGVNESAKDGDVGGLCDALADDILEAQYQAKGDEGRKKCEEDLKSNVDALKKDAEGKFEVKDVKVDGDSASATVVDNDGDNPIKLRKQDGDWKISELSGT